MSINAVGMNAMSDPQIVSGASSYGSPDTKMSNLFEQIDSSGTGAMSQDQFNVAFQTMNPPLVFKAAGADAIFGQLDPAGSGSVSQPDFVKTMTGLMKSLRSDRASNISAASAGQTPSDTIAASLNSLNRLGGSSDPFLDGGIGSNVNLLA